MHDTVPFFAVEGDDDGLATPRTVGGAHEVDLPAGPGVGPVTEALGATLPDQVHLQGAVDEVQVVVLAGQDWIIGHIDWMHLEHGVPVHVLVEPMRAKGERGEHLVAMEILALVGHDARLDEGEDPVPEHLGADAKVILVPSCWTTASGMPPMPTCRVAPSGIRSATNAPIACSTGPIVAGGSSASGSSFSTNAVTCETWTWQSPKQIGTWGLTSSTSARAREMAAIV
jgi:hypothetical protein